MKKSEHYTCAIVAVLESDMKTSTKAEVLRTLIERLKTEEILEKSEEE